VGPNITFETPDGHAAFGREATYLVQLCDAYVDALIEGALRKSQEPVARAARALQRSIGAVGLEALIDEATGYQQAREGEYLQRRLEAFLLREADGWERRFSRELVGALCTLYGHPYGGGRFPPFLRSVFAKIYEFVLGDDIAKQLRVRNPMPRMGRNHHQFLRQPVQRSVGDDLRVVELLAEQSGSPAEFWARIATHFRKVPLQLPFGAHRTSDDARPRVAG
jgi:hypothetical protein